jgi:acetyl-CoA carboxylase beta subunit
MKNHSATTINPKILKASNVRAIDPVVADLAESLAAIDILNFIKIYNERIKASNLLAENKRKEPITEIGKDEVVGIELLIDPTNKTVQFYSLTSSEKGYGRKIVKAVVDAVPDDWSIVVVFDSSGGFWQKMIEEFSRIEVI